MAPRIFVLGVTGYVGGHTVDVLLRKHPDYQVITLVRNDNQAEIITAAFPTVETVIGDLDSDEIIQEEAGKADVVINIASADHSPGVISIIKGIGAGKKNAVFIHVSGTGIIIDTSTGLGNASTKIWHDKSTADIQEILSFDLSHLHRDVEALVVAKSAEHGVKSAIICPPSIHGVGRGPLKKRSMQIPWMIQSTLKRGKAFQVLKGENVWNAIHVDDLASALIFLTEEAIKGSTSKVAWLPEAYFFAETAEHRQSDFSTAIAKVAHAKGLLKTDQVEIISVEDTAPLHPWGAMVWASNSRSKAEKLRELGWKPSGRSWVDGIGEAIDFEVDAAKESK